MSETNLRTFLSMFTVQELADALNRGGLPQAGTKDEKIRRLLGAVREPRALLDLFSAEALRMTCGAFEVAAGPKAEMIEQCLALIHSDAFVRVAPADLIADQAGPHTPLVEATRERVLEHLRGLSIPRRKAQDEGTAQDAIGMHLAEVFLDVVPQYNIGGYLGLKIDIDLGNGRVGVEVKLATSLLKATEAHRLIGQAVYYQQRRYKDSLIVAVVGRSEELEYPMLKELRSFLESFGITYIGVPVT